MSLRLRWPRFVSSFPGRFVSYWACYRYSSSWQRGGRPPPRRAPMSHYAHTPSATSTISGRSCSSIDWPFITSQCLCPRRLNSLMLQHSIDTHFFFPGTCCHACLHRETVASLSSRELHSEALSCLVQTRRSLPKNADVAFQLGAQTLELQSPQSPIEHVLALVHCYGRFEWPSSSALIGAMQHMVMAACVRRC